MSINVTVNMVTAEVTVNTSPINAQINCCGNGVYGVPPDGDVGDVLTKTGAGATDYDWLPPGSAADFEIYPAGENLSSGRAVVINAGEAFYFQPADPTHYGRAFGITKTSATTGNDVTIQKDGVITDAAFNSFSDEVLYVGTDGELQTTWNAGEMVQKAGIAAEAGDVKIDFSIQIQLI